MHAGNGAVPPQPARTPAALPTTPDQGSGTRAHGHCLSRRRIIASLSALPLFLATACQGLPNPLAFPTATPTGPRPLRLAFPGGTSTDYVTTLVKDVAQHFPPEANLRLEPIFVDVGANDQGSIGRYVQTLKNLPSSGVPDLILTYTSVIPPLDKANVVRDLRDLLKTERWFRADDFYGNALVAGQLRGKQLCVPLDLSVEAVFYNQQAFASAKVAPPQLGWTWDEFASAAQSLTLSRADATSGRWGCQIAPFYPSFETMGWQRDAKVASDDGSSLDLTEKGTADGMQFLADLILKQRVSPPLSPAIVADPARAYETVNNSLASVDSGQVAMISYLTSPFYFWWRRLNLGDVALAEMPTASKKATSAASNLQLAIPTSPPDEKHSLNSLRYLIEASSQSIFLPARKGVSDLRKLQPFLTEAEAAALKAMLEVARCLSPAIVGNQDLYLLLAREYVVPILAGQKTAAQAGRDAQPLVREALSTL